MSPSQLIPSEIHRVNPANVRSCAPVCLQCECSIACSRAVTLVDVLWPFVKRLRAREHSALGIPRGGDAEVLVAPMVACYAREDAVVGISSSGSSSNVNRALARARQKGMLTIGLAGRDGGRMVDVAEHVLVGKSWSIHRIQETHTLLLHLLWDLVHVALGEEDVV